ncbi:MAG: hypothetical protein B7Z38_07055, partial [Rhodobacterales bacterium 12-64-8]
IAYYVTIPLVRAYQVARAAKSKERGEQRSLMRALLAEAASKLTRPDEPAGDVPQNQPGMSLAAGPDRQDPRHDPSKP